MTKEDIQKRYFTDGEEILWEGKPDTLKYFSRTDICLVPITLLIAWFLLTYAYTAFMMMLSGQNFVFALSGITILLIAFYLVFGRIWYRHKRLSRNLYFVTNRRVFVFNTLRDTVDVDISLAEVSTEVFRNDLFLSYKYLGGDLIHGLGLDLFMHNAKETPAFYAIFDPDKVAKLIKKAKKSRKAASSNDHDSEFI